MLPAFVFHGIGCCVTHLNVWNFLSNIYTGSRAFPKEFSLID